MKFNSKIGVLFVMLALVAIRGVDNFVWMRLERYNDLRKKLLNQRQDAANLENAERPSEQEILRQKIAKNHLQKNVTSTSFFSDFFSGRY